MSEATPATNATPTYKIIIVSGQEFSVPVETDNEAVRQHLTPQFPDLANAKIEPGMRDVDGVKVQTVEFVKKAGTKGLGHADLIALLDQVPAADPFSHDTVSYDHVRLLRKLQAGVMTCADAIAQAEPLSAALHKIVEGPLSRRYEGDTVCTQLDRLPASAGTHLPIGW